MPAPSHVPLSALDLVPLSEGRSTADALREATALARRLEAAGYGRLWYAEHHNTEAFASSATAVLIGQALAATEHLRVGSGGIMLPNHVPLTVAEAFGTLANLYPGRVDLGLGRAPGTDMRTALELRRGSAGHDTFEADVRRLVRLFGGQEQEVVRAPVARTTDVPLWILGSSTGGAELAARLGLPYAFASHFAPAMIMDAIALYRQRFDAGAPTATIERPHVMVAANVLAADSDEEARHQFTTHQLLVRGLARNDRGPLRPPVDRVELTAAEAAMVEQHLAVSAVGTPEHVVAELEQIVEITQADELMLNSYAHDPEVRARSYELVAQAW
ncbi:LLM class flavin-dependent oxidoreductase [Kocuria rosea]|uniref:LLM class flavin-dependent oxidoreductase n=1 Tax=Kocuria rosea TaxID=1275 RepID=UPI00203A42C5|nr:LLM class flavin-dependent oxidoreductase [Kocuria rosea]MCM3686443.1 LLM class flavin-dependent oxidoreductase [Kocuria rosea]